ncbi:hypothetical protein [Rubinisphaera margarita]|uniref:hypothetical protein n=1 Tax=Rubinisphaera margarita TaxID=2909586 RepID=UPI001EE7F321|nr:hypothetical protein [Rubinisphaera margarita]MCG6156197.1 hypothetical protein [Rubinisphaera margarita]
MNTDSAIQETTDCAQRLTASQYRAPRGDLEIFLQPPLAQTVERILANRQQFQQSDLVIWGRPLGDWRRLARQEFLQQAAGGALPQGICEHAPLILTGHQPELYHPGVLLKNMLAGFLAEAVDGCAANVTVDSDVVKSRRMTLPTLTDDQLEKSSLVIDEWTFGSPWEETGIVNQELFESLPERVSRNVAPLSQSSLLPPFWDEVVSRTAERNDLVDGLIAGRQYIEHRLGLQNRETRLSRIAQSETFLCFLAGIIGDAGKFCRDYNQALFDYRACYDLKSDSHPMPDLVITQDLTELPFWVWSSENPRRKGLFLRTTGNVLELTDRNGWSVQLPADTTDSGLNRVEFLREIASQGIKIRSRALLTTLYLRLFVADWFIHGIGGAKYDEITDDLICRYFRFPPPDYQVASGTAYLPLKRRIDPDEADPVELQARLRHAEENPELLLTVEQREQIADRLEEKQTLIRQREESRTEGLTKRQRRELRPRNQERHERLKQIRSELAALAEQPLQELREQIATARELQSQRTVSADREYPFCLYPLSKLQELQHALTGRGTA